MSELCPCPACGYGVFEEGPGSYETCPVCHWQDDAVQLLYPLWAGGANEVCLVEAQRAALTHWPLETQIAFGFVRDVEWRPLEPDEAAECGPGPLNEIDYFELSGCPGPDYYWRSPA